MTYEESIKSGSIEIWDSVMPALCSVEMTSYAMEMGMTHISYSACSIAEKDTVEIIEGMIKSAGDV